VVFGNVCAVAFDLVQVYPFGQFGIRRTRNYVDFVPQALELPGQMINIYPLPPAEHVTAVGKEAYFHKTFTGC
jgi:hypothetical protein